MAKALVLFSGGMDSTVSLYWARARFGGVTAVGFHYGQRHAVELDQADTIAKLASVPFRIVDLRGLLAGSALIDDTSRAIDDRHPADSSLPASFVPGRNLLFLSVAAGIAYREGIHDLVAGMCHTDYSGYPDCRREFVDAAERALSLAMAPHSFTIHTPIMEIDKADTFKLASDLGILDIVLEHSHTDYLGHRQTRHPWGYGRLDNDASRLRARGYAEFCARYPHLAPKEPSAPGARDA